MMKNLKHGFPGNSEVEDYKGITETMTKEKAEKDEVFEAVVSIRDDQKEKEKVAKANVDHTTVMVNIKTRILLGKTVPGLHHLGTKDLISPHPGMTTVIKPMKLMMMKVLILIGTTGTIVSVQKERKARKVKRVRTSRAEKVKMPVKDLVNRQKVTLHILLTQELKQFF